MMIRRNEQIEKPRKFNFYGRKKGKRLSPLQAKYIKEYLTVSLPLILGQSIAVMDEQLFRIFGSFLGAGTVASFRYARRIVLLPVGIVAQAVGVASYPTLSKLFLLKKS